MTHYLIDYTELTPQQAYNKAYDDIADYLGNSKFDKMVADFRQYPPMSVEDLAMYLSIAGISGYPVTVFHDLIWPYG